MKPLWSRTLLLVLAVVALATAGCALLGAAGQNAQDPAVAGPAADAVGGILGPPWDALAGLVALVLTGGKTALRVAKKSPTPSA